MNWRGIVTHPDAKAEDKAALEQAIADMQGSAEWADVLKQRSWSNTYLPAADFAVFLDSEETRIAEALKAAGVIN